MRGEEHSQTLTAYIQGKGIAHTCTIFKPTEHKLKIILTTLHDFLVKVITCDIKLRIHYEKILQRLMYIHVIIFLCISIKDSNIIWYRDAVGTCACMYSKWLLMLDISADCLQNAQTFVPANIIKQ